MSLTPLSRIFIAVLIVFPVLFSCSHPIKSYQYGPVSDEGYYYQYASLVEHKGMPAFSRLIFWYSDHAEAREHPAPVRVGYILLIALLFKIFGPSFAVQGLISTASLILFLGLCFYYVRKYFDLDTALLTLLFLASSPLILGLSRRALVDSSVNFWWAACVWLLADVLFKPKSWSYIVFLVALIMAILFKETSIILIPFFMLAASGLENKAEGVARARIWGILIWPVVILLPLYVWIYGGWGNVTRAVVAIFNTHLSSTASLYAIYFSSGPWFRYLLDFLLITPIVLLLFIGYTGYLCVQRTALDDLRMYFLSYFIYVYGVLSCLSHSKVVRFVVNLEMVMALFAVLMLREIFKSANDKGRSWLLYAAVGVFLYNWASFLNLFYGPVLLDPISRHLLVFRHFIPGWEP